MSAVVACISMLHEEHDGSAMLHFRNRPVLSWTIERLRLASGIDDIVVLCWDDQQQAVESAALKVRLLVRGVRSPQASMNAITAARRWADGWRGGLLQTCDFDAGFDARAILEAIDPADAAVLVDPSSALVDPRLIEALIKHAAEAPDQEMCFMPAGLGLGGALLRRILLERLCEIRMHPGKFLHYLPDQPVRDPIAGEGCVAIPTKVARTAHNFHLKSPRDIRAATDLFEPLNGQLVTSDAETLIDLAASNDRISPLPREVVLELNTNRISRRIDRPQDVQRPMMTRDCAAQLLDELAGEKDVRITIAGVGDPLESETLFEILTLATERGIRAVGIETDLLCDDSHRIEQLAVAPLDLISIHIPAATVSTYAAIMGVDRMTRVLENTATLVSARARRGDGLPLLVPTFVKCKANLSEMELWYDQWIRALSCAVILGPSDYAGQIGDIGVADMSPPKRRACRRLRQRLTVLSDGTVVACEQDYRGVSALGRVGEMPLSKIWLRQMNPLRVAHACGQWSAAHPLCGKCREWNRP